jgi:2-polyprenyl-6-hydroxyphenyl methylase/3-demethylubiquinone-9 3-methyltransferase
MQRAVHVKVKIMDGYYTEQLAAERLKLCYDIASPRVRQYLEAEIAFTLDHIRAGQSVLEVGCGYGRVTERLAARGALTIGIDTSFSSIAMAVKKRASAHIHFGVMDAVRTGFGDGTFDVVVCVQNGMSAFRVDRPSLMRECLRVARSGGLAIFSSYADAFWDDRLAWFRAQADAGLIGQIDAVQTGDGLIVCKDGFTATTIRPDEWRALARSVNRSAVIEVVDESSVFCVVRA